MDIKFDADSGEVLGWVEDEGEGYFGNAPNVIRVPETPQIASALFRNQLKVSGGRLVSTTGKEAFYLRKQKLAMVGLFAKHMDTEIRSLLPFDAEELSLLPNYLEFALSLRLNTTQVNAIWQHFQAKVAEIRAAADKTALDAIQWRP